MAITHVQYRTGSTAEGSSVSVTLVSAPTDGNYLFCVIGAGSEGGTPTVSSIQQTGSSANFTLIGSQITANQAAVFLYYLPWSTGDGNTTTVTLGSTVKDLSVIVDEFSGVNTSTPHDNDDVGNSGKSTSPSWSSITAANSSFMYGGMAAGGLPTFTTPTGYTGVSLLPSDKGRTARIYKGSPSGTEAPTGTLSATSNWVTYFAEILVASSPVAADNRGPILIRRATGY